MGQVLHSSATTTEAIRRAIQDSQESLRQLAKRYGINQKTVAKWKSRDTVTDRRTGPTEPRSTVLSVEEEAVIVAALRTPAQWVFGGLTIGGLLGMTVMPLLAEFGRHPPARNRRPAPHLLDRFRSCLLDHQPLDSWCAMTRCCSSSSRTTAT